MPLSDHRGIVSGFLKQFRQGQHIGRNTKRGIRRENTHALAKPV